MDELTLYFVKSSGVLLLFLSLYYVWLRKDTFFHGNRFFLLAGMIISLVLPFLVITKYVEIPFVEETLGSNMFVYTETGNEVIAPIFSWTDILMYTYVAGVLFFLSKFLIELASLCKLLWTSTVTKRDGQFIYIETATSFTPFSFFNYIVYNPELYSASELEAILIHEKAHSRQLHSIDVFISKLYCIFMWFNPLAWVHQKYISQNLEFLADSAAIKQTPSKKEYQLTLLKVSGNAYCPALTNNFYNSLIKKRIVMLQKNQSTRLHKWKQVLILPLLVAFVMLFNTEVIAKEVSTTTTSTPSLENTIVKEMYGDVMVTINKNTTVKELKAIQKMFKSFDITLNYDIKKFNSRDEIVAIKLELKDKAGAKASATFESQNDKPIPTVKLGKKDGTLIVTSSKAKHYVTSTAYEFHSDEDHDGKDGKNKYVIKSKHTNKKGGTTKTWIQKDDVETINIKKVDGKEVIIVNGKKINPDEIIEEEIEIKKGDGKHFVVVGSHIDSENEDVEVEVNNGKDSKIVIRNSGSKKPLFVMDGKIIKEDQIRGLDPNKIEGISVLKGDNATALYGKKGENGVVVITTKKK
ncbi:M56 family metallopeptidase [uncultured Kordia sp.]|uniref:M56 family metallopeptidase n=1 Tax=uncultured Kordia sp. TaxID=507699 RepID=UPI00263291C7|nr:M56 family metallopeptidase [uncultured Kordia sp.]